MKEDTVAAKYLEVVDDVDDVQTVVDDVDDVDDVLGETVVIVDTCSKHNLLSTLLLE